MTGARTRKSSLRLAMAMSRGWRSSFQQGRRLTCRCEAHEFLHVSGHLQTVTLCRPIHGSIPSCEPPIGLEGLHKLHVYQAAQYR